MNDKAQFKLVTVVIPWYKRLYFWIFKKEPTSKIGIFTVE